MEELCEKASLPAVCCLTLCVGLSLCVHIYVDSFSYLLQINTLIIVDFYFKLSQLLDLFFLLVCCQLCQGLGCTCSKLIPEICKFDEDQFLSWARLWCQAINHFYKTSQTNSSYGLVNVIDQETDNVISGDSSSLCHW